MDRKKVLVVDDNPEIIEIVRILLQSEGYIVEEATSGDEAIAKLTTDIDLVILDIMMPGKNGYRTCVEIREISTVPILFLTAKTQESDKSMGFSSGGDDYLSKPFSYTELVSRVKALIRRYCTYKGKVEKEVEGIINIDELQINTNINEVRRNDVEINLTEIEYKIFLLLASNRKKIFSAQTLYESVWNEPYLYTANNTIMVHIRKLRMKIEDNPQNPKYIKTVWGKGYRID